MGFFDSKSSSTSTTNNYDYRTIEENDNEGLLSGNEGEVEYNYTYSELDGDVINDAFQYVGDSSSDAYDFADNATERAFDYGDKALGNLQEQSGEAFDFAASVVSDIVDSTQNNSDSNRELFAALGQQQSEAFTGGQSGIIDSLGNNLKWVAAFAAVVAIVRGMG